MLNRVILIGRLAVDPELRYTQSGVAVTNFRIAVDRAYTNQQGEREADFFPIVTWRKLGTAAVTNTHPYPGAEGQFAAYTAARVASDVPGTAT